MNTNDPASSRPAQPIATAKLDRSLVNASGDSIRYLVIDVTAPQATVVEGAPKLPLDIALVLDASGSMQGASIEAAREAVRKLLGSLSDDDRVSLVSFADDVITHASSVATDQLGNAQIESEIARLRTRGSTDLAAGWLQGCECVAVRKATAGRIERDHVFLLSDGHANRGIVLPQQLAAHADALRQRGVPSSTIGIGVGYSPTQLQAIAEAGGGRMHDAERPEEIAEIVLAELGDTRNTVLQDVAVHLDLPAGTQAFAFGAAHTTTRYNGVEVLLGSMLAGARRTLVVQLRTPAGHHGSSLEVRASLRWRHVETGEVGGVALPPNELTFAFAHECEMQPRDVVTSLVAVQQWQAWVVHRSMQMNQVGDIQEAYEFVAQQLRHMIRYSRNLPGCEAYIEALNRLLPTLNRRYDMPMAKEMMLSSYKRSRMEQDRRSMQRHVADEFLPGS